ncbi:multicopper oxidase type 2 [Gemmatirosa kalamazoonensis]|uniref:Multicopper oxidase type 2 n=1 Tax=Gemmatirosa kalamazoonensis TaxID=861299 RepID=W0RCN6_9BACT|nr:multicopper oxidase domain-containing protein [Gemmatirosa kalamazoonensis]AHG88561.1 multicopper oxidase type 2 [Gemmatirosa kalamazoonensis]
MRPTLLPLAMLTLAAAHHAAPPEVVPNDNRVAAGHLAHGVLTLELEAREATWYPETDAGPGLPVYAFAEAGRPPSIPGPLIRVPAGTELHVTVRNTLPKRLRLAGLQEHQSESLDSVDIAPGATQAFRFRVDAPGTYLYGGKTEVLPRGRHAPLVGAFIVDPAGATPPKHERVLVINFFSDTVAALGVKSEAADRVLRRELAPPERWILFTVNGLSWPYTERLSYAVGDTVRWRIVNGTPAPHPMHLHGFYFDVDSKSDGPRDTIYAPGERRKAVTEVIEHQTTMTVTWTPTRPGNWLFHCHLVQHFDGALRLGHAADDGATHASHAESEMAGLVMGIHVAPPDGRVRVVSRTPEPAPRRKLRLYVTERAHVYGDQPGYSYVLQEGPTPPAPDSIRTVSSTLVLRRHEPTEITVVNRSHAMAGIHWHGLEIESYYDGVVGWSGWQQRVAPAIAPNDSFVVRVTPPRAGTFMYHTHMSEAGQLTSGQSGALLVTPERARLDTTDRVFLMTYGGPNADSPATVNGLETPPPVELRAGVAYRFRFINISPIEYRLVQLLRDSTVQTWRAVAKDGADLPPQQAAVRRAVLSFRPGETYDFEVRRDRPDSLTLVITAPRTLSVPLETVRRGVTAATIPLQVTRIPVVVR